jgi:excisionase family DNA binding protein
MGKKVSLRATGDELGISLRGVRRLISSGELPAYRVGRAAVRIDIDDIAAVLKPILPGDVAPTPPQFVRAQKAARQARARKARARKAARDKQARGGVA